MDTIISTSLWQNKIKLPIYPKLSQDLVCDVCVIGAGISGISTAYFLAKQGIKVAVLEDGKICSGETSRTTAHIVTAHDDRFYEIENLIGFERTKIVAESYVQCVNQIAENIEEEQIDCDFIRLNGYLTLREDDTLDTLKKEKKCCDKLSLSGVELLETSPFNFFNAAPCLEFKNQAQFNPLKYVLGLVKRIEAEGGLIFCDTHAQEINSGKYCSIKTASGLKVECKSIVVATNTPVNDIVTIHTKQAPYRTYVIASDIPRDALQPFLLWETGHPYNYVRIVKGDSDDSFDTLIIGGEDHKTGQADDAEKRFENLETWMRKRFPFAGKITYHWSGQVLESIDGLPFLGKNPLQENVYIITGDSGTGMTHGTMGGMLVSDLIIKGHHAWEEIYDPSRKTLKAFPKFLKENVNVVGQYTHWFNPSPSDSSLEVLPGQGEVVQVGLKKKAVYKDMDGKIYEFSAMCPHLGGEITWNSLEKTWDCPCHGSRFLPDGTVINGPANSNLSPINNSTIIEKEQIPDKESTILTSPTPQLSEGQGI